MKFIVREGFVIHDETARMVNGKILRQENSYFGNDEVDLDETKAALHAHKLEGTNKESKAWLDGLVLTNYQAPVAQEVDHAAITAGVIAALVEQGVIARPQPQAPAKP